jgi:hypothetical protein
MCREGSMHLFAHQATVGVRGLIERDNVLLCIYVAPGGPLYDDSMSPSSM